MKRLIALFFVFSVAILPFLGFAGPVSDFSEMENRVLQQMPTFTTEAVLSGGYMRDVTNYVQDQFWQRPWWIQAKNACERLLGRKDIGNAFLGPEYGTYFEKRTEVNEAFLSTNLRVLDEFSHWSATQGVSNWFLGIYSPATVYPERLPYFAPVADERALATRVAEASDALTYIDSLEELTAEHDSYLFFSTDHHWTARGAYAGYRSLAQGMGFTPKPLADFTVSVVPGFYGTLFSRAPLFNVIPDKVEFFRDSEVEVEMQSGKEILDTPIVLENATKKDKYTIFLGGVQPQITIHTNTNNERRLLILKESFTHPLVPFLVSHFEEIYLLDLRYYKNSVRDYLVEHQITDLLFSYNLSWFAADAYFGSLD